ncbi:UDP-N-acetylmuramoyl-L-alanine--D-glutamate ligase [Candidatus Leptofilum sp.]|uniref:UDP-N-acetylmuramoyl-L-alanine--D-glutamate ligase n=1 Tax=Candidatus Leptofilum sp. TaxID=3241576 RepID=UPI003B5A1B02
MDNFYGKRLLILGLARQGKALARFAVGAGAAVTITDLRSPEKLRDILDELSDLNIRYVLREHPMELVDESDILAVSGGVPLETPLVQAAQARGIPITNDSLEFSKRTPTAVIGITGSAGKTTTTALTGVMSQIAGRRTWVGGNIGQPLIADLHKMEADDVVVQELSSFQLEIWDRSPHIATVLNITPNHLDRHKTMKAYTNAKANILRHQTADDIAVLCADDPGSLALSAIVQGQLRLFSLSNEVSEGAMIRNGRIVIRNGAEKEICHVNEVQLRGRHNLLNVLAATTLADSAGIPAEAIAQAIRTFTGVEHRLELVRTRNGVQWINDSIATAPERSLAALQAFSEPIILLAGGQDKAMEWDAWAEAVPQQTISVILFGELADLLAKKLTEQQADFVKVNTMEEAVEVAVETAVSNDIVLLSPGGTSFDAFDNFAERGELFRQLVNEL